MNPKLKEFNMMHAFDCTHLSVRDLQDRIKYSKEKDNSVRRKMQ